MLLKRLLVLCTIVLLFYSLVFIVPTACSGFNKPCYLSNNELEAMRHMAKVIIETLEELNETYWLESGTLLGAYRHGDILKHDYDLDIGRIRHKKYSKEYKFGDKFHEIMKKKYNMSANPMIVSYMKNNKQFLCDMSQFKQTYNKKTKQYLLYESYHSKSWSDNFKRTSFPREVILPTTRIMFLGRLVRVPGQYKKYLKMKYPYSLNVRFPYKWRCWLPWN